MFWCEALCWLDTNPAMSKRVRTDDDDEKKDGDEVFTLMCRERPQSFAVAFHVNEAQLKEAADTIKKALQETNNAEGEVVTPWDSKADITFKHRTIGRDVDAMLEWLHTTSPGFYELVYDDDPDNCDAPRDIGGGMCMPLAGTSSRWAAIMYAVAVMCKTEGPNTPSSTGRVVLLSLY